MAAMAQRPVNTRLAVGSFFLFVFIWSACKLHATTSADSYSQFHRTSWTSKDGVGAVFDVKQSPDGYLWLTTSRGVLRFDGARFQTLEEVTNGAIRNDEVLSVLISRTGRVWLTTRTAGLLLWEDQRVTIVSVERRCISAALTDGMTEDLDGSLWVRGISGLYHLRGSTCDRIGTEDGYPGGFPAAILVDHKGTVWVKAPSGALLSRSQSELKFKFLQFVSGPSSNAAHLHQASGGEIWLSDDDGLREVGNGSGISLPSTLPRRKDYGKSPFGDFAFGADGSLWAASSRGARRFEPQQWRTEKRIDEGNTEVQFYKGGLGSSIAWKLLLDREKNIWLGTNSGLDQLRRTVITPIDLPPSQGHQFAIGPGTGGSLWIGNSDLPLTRVASDGTAVVFPNIRGTTCIRRDRKGTIWAAGEGKVDLWRSSGSTFLPVHHPDQGLARIVSMAVDRNDELWINMRPGQTYHLTRSGWRMENEALGKRPGVIGEMVTDDQGNIWFDFGFELVRWDGRSYTTFVFGAGPLDISVVAMNAHGDHIWLAGQGGIVMFRNGHFFRMAYKDPNLLGRISGIVETESGDLWMNGFSGVTHVPREVLAHWLRDPSILVSGEHFDDLDGLPGLSGERFPVPSLVETQNKYRWFATTKGIAWLNPASLQDHRNSVPPPVYIESVNSNGRSFPAARDIILPKHTTSIEINYTALSLTIPERVSFRYKLDGIDHDWQDPGSRRQAFYTNLPPGHYRFHAIACNNDGVWNLDGASIGIDITPAFYQTWYFKVVLCAIAAVLLAWLVKLRIRAVSRQLSERLGERLAERERIARDLHDTFFQGVQGILLRFNTGTRKLSKEDPVRMMFEEALNQSDRVMVEGRELVSNLHKESHDLEDLAGSLAATGNELKQMFPCEFQVVVNGSLSQLRPEVAEELYRIGREALYNAFSHSKSTTIEMELNYERNQLRLCIRDNGAGIAPDILNAGNVVGHWGLPGMRERAKKIGGYLNLWSQLGAGTEVEVRVPAQIAYLASRATFWRGLFPRKHGK
jgi:signal transduction histidine kinase/ligand-binding sensor domain-containing protein